MMEVADADSLPEEMLDKILSYLDPKSLKAARLVCRRWNAAAMKYVQKDLKLLAWRVDWKGGEDEDMESDDDMPLVLRYQAMPPKLFTNLDFVRLAEYYMSIAVESDSSDSLEDSDSDESRTHSIYLGAHHAFRMSCLNFLGDCGYYHHVKRIWILENEQAESLAVATSKGYLPNLEELTVVESNSPRFYEYRQQFQAGSLVKLKILKFDISTYRHSVRPLRSFLLSILDAAPNLQTFTSDQVFPLTNQKNLQQLQLSMDPIPALGGQILEMLNNVKETITHLSMGCSVSVQFPVLTKLRKLEICSHQTLWTEIATKVPSLQYLKTCCRQRKNMMISRYLDTKPSSLKIVEIRCCDGHAVHQQFTRLCNAVIEQAPNLQLLKIVSCCALSGDHPNLLDFIVSLDFPNVVVDSDHEHNLTMTNIIQRLEIVHVRRRKTRGKIEFRNCKFNDCTVHLDLLKQTTTNTNCIHLEDDATIQKFPFVIVNLRRNWDRIHFRHFDIQDPWMSTLARDIERFYLPVEVYGSTSYSQE